MLKRLLPYLVALFALVWVLRQVDRHELISAVRHAPLGLFLAVSTVMLVVNLLCDTFAMHRVFSWFGCQVPYKDLVVVRAASYLLAVVNYHVGQAAIVGFLYRACGVPLLRASGWILFIIGINVGTIFLLSAAGASHATLPVIRAIPILVLGGISLYALILWGRPSILTRRSLFAPLFQMGIRGHIKGVLVRLPHVAVLLAWWYLSMELFGVHLPRMVALLYLPAYIATASLPINVNGLGVAQIVAVTFFAPYAEVPIGALDALAAQKAAVTACCLCCSIFSILFQLLTGLLCLDRATRLGMAAQPRAETAPEEVSSVTAPS
jgi:hypothetical protein